MALSRDPWLAVRTLLQTFSASLDGATFLDDCLDVLVELLDADRGLILRLSTDGGSFAVNARSRGRALSAIEREEISKTVVNDAAAASRAIIWDAPKERNAESIAQLNIFRALAAPLRVPGRDEAPIAVVYLDFRRAEALPSEPEREFLDAIAGLMGAMVAQHDALHRTRVELRAARDATAPLAPDLDAILGLPGLECLRRDVQAFLPGDDPLLIEGESGTGKTLLAHAIAEGSTRRPIVRATLGGADDLNTITSELFGHERGAFSGAVGKRVGLVEHADGGTLILDEVLNLPLRAQQLLLDFTQFGTYRPLGHDGPSARRADVRVIAATNGDLNEAVAEGRFREDLYYRLAGATLQIPPLRDRPEDAPAIAESYLAKLSGSSWRLSMSLRRLLAWDAIEWPGNVRQLEAIVRRAKGRAGVRGERVLRTEDLECRELGVAAFPDELTRGAPSRLPPAPENPAPATPGRALESIREQRERLSDEERLLLKETLQRCGGTVARAAKELGMSRTSLLSRLSTLGIER